MTKTWKYLAATLPATPEVPDELAESPGNLALHAERIVLVDVLHIVLVLEVLHDLWRVGQALHRETALKR